jgi:hypothetical protein
MAVELVDHLAILVAIHRFPCMCAADSRSLRSYMYVRMPHFVRRTTYVPFRRFLRDMRREFIQRLYDTLHGTIMGSYLRDAFEEGSASVVACLHVPRAYVFSSFLLFAWWPPLLCLVRIYYYVYNKYHSQHADRKRGGGTNAERVARDLSLFPCLSFVIVLQ